MLSLSGGLEGRNVCRFGSDLDERFSELAADDGHFVNKK